MPCRTIQVRLLTFLVLLVTTSVVAMAQAHFYVSIAKSGSTMHASGTSDAGTAMLGYHQAYSTLTLRSPKGRSVQVSDMGNPSIVTDAYMDTLREDGVYTADNMGSVYCLVARQTIASGDPQQSTTVKPWVQINAVSWSKNPMKWQNDSSNMQVTLWNSENCTGSATVQGHLTPPPGMKISLSQSANVNLDTSGSALALVGATTDSTNQVQGAVGSGASIYAYPANCNVTGSNPFTGPNLTVSNLP
jgi:hypothetical protein